MLVRGETAMLRQTQASSASEHDMCGLGQLTISLKGLLPMIIRAKLPGRNKITKFSPVLSPGQWLAKQVVAGQSCHVSAPGCRPPAVSLLG